MAGAQEIRQTIFEESALFVLNLNGEEVIDQNGDPFNSEAYSRFKYGDGVVIESYAAQLADNLIEGNPDDIAEGYIASSAYKHVPTAAHALSKALVSELVLRGHPPAGIFRIDRANVLSNDYSALSEAEREACAKNNGLTLPASVHSDIRDGVAFVIDDIKVTGVHEMNLRMMLGNVGLKKLFFGYVAVIEPEVARRHPAIEHRINHAQIRSLADLVDIAFSPGFTLNARTCKFILNASESDMNEFVASLPRPVVKNMLSSMVADGYHTMPDFRAAFENFTRAIKHETAGAI